MPVKKATVTISFRLDPYHHGLLAEAAARAGLSPGEQARRLTVEGLTGDALGRLRHDSAELRQALARLHADLKTATAVLLLDAGQAASAEEALGVVRDSLTGEGP